MTCPTRARTTGCRSPVTYRRRQARGPVSGTLLTGGSLPLAAHCQMPHISPRCPSNHGLSTQVATAERDPSGDFNCQFNENTAARAYRPAGCSSTPPLRLARQRWPQQRYSWDLKLFAVSRLWNLAYVPVGSISAELKMILLKRARASVCAERRKAQGTVPRAVGRILERRKDQYQDAGTTPLFQIRRSRDVSTGELHPCWVAHAYSGTTTRACRCVQLVSADASIMKTTPYLVCFPGFHRYPSCRSVPGGRGEKRSTAPTSRSCPSATSEFRKCATAQPTPPISETTLRRAPAETPWSTQCKLH